MGSLLFSGWFEATQWLVAFGFYGINLSLILVALYMFARSCFKNFEMGVAVVIITMLTGITKNMLTL